MTVCLDTGVFLQIFGRRQPFHPIFRALLDGRLTLAVSTEILLEYQEIITRLSGAERWRAVARVAGIARATSRKHPPRRNKIPLQRDFN